MEKKNWGGEVGISTNTMMNSSPMAKKAKLPYLERLTEMFTANNVAEALVAARDETQRQYITKKHEKWGDRPEPVTPDQDKFFCDTDPFSFLPPAIPQPLLPADLVVEFPELKSTVKCVADAIFVKFLITRRFKIEEVAERFLNLRQLIIEHELSFTMDDDVRIAVSLGVFHFLPIKIDKGTGCPVFTVTPRNLNWEKGTVRQMKKGWFFAAWTLISSTAAAQAMGIVLQNSMKDFAPSSQAKVEFAKFFASAIQKCLPSRLHIGFIANAPWGVRNIMFPILTQFLGKKIRARIHMIDDPKPIHDFFGPWQKTLILNEIGSGERKVDEKSIAKQLDEAEKMCAAITLSRAAAAAA